MNRVSLQLLRSPTAIFALAFLVVAVVLCFGAPLFAPFAPNSGDLSTILQSPSTAHWLGTDELGRDVVSRLLYGGQSSFLGILLVVGVALVIGIPVGISAGYYGGFADGFASRIVDIVLAIPVIVILLTVFAVFGQSQSAAMLALGILYSPIMIRVARAATLTTSAELFVAAARVSGLRSGHVMVRHILPRITGPIVVNTALLAANALLVQSGLAFLGLGVALPNPSWGNMVAEGGTVLQQQPWLIIPSGATIALTVLAFVLLGDAIRDATEDVRSSTVRDLRTTSRVRQHLVPKNLDAPRIAQASGGLTVTDLSIELPLRAGWTTVVDGVSFEVRPGETVGLVGESGCGKTVTAMSILGLVPGSGRVSGGSIDFGGQELTSMTAGQLAAVRGKQIAFIAQEPMASLDPSFTVGSQLTEAVRQHEGGSRRAATTRARELLAMTGLRNVKEVAKSYPHQISGGMAQRVVIARALAGRPALLIADEPTTALDSTVQREILAVLRRIQQDTGMSIILVTHDWGVVAETCDRAVVMYAGQVIEEADITDIFDLPLHPYTGLLLAANPHLAEHGARIVTIEGSVPPPAEWPAGCRFAARCPLATEECRVAAVPLTVAGEQRMSRCLYIDELTELDATVLRG